MLRSIPHRAESTLCRHFKKFRDEHCVTHGHVFTKANGLSLKSTFRYHPVLNTVAHVSVDSRARFILNLNVGDSPNCQGNSTKKSASL